MNHAESFVETLYCVVTQCITVAVTHLTVWPAYLSHILSFESQKCSAKFSATCVTVHLKLTSQHACTCVQVN